MNLLDRLSEISGTDKFIFAAYHETDKIKQGRHFVGTFDKHKKSLETLNTQGYGIYVTVNHSNNGKRKKEDIELFRAIWVDDDTGYTDKGGKYPLNPHLSIQTSQGKYQHYWFIDAPNISQEEWSRVQKNMVKYGCDSSATDASRVLRLPGFNHCKDLSNLQIVQEIHYSARESFSWTKIKEAFGEAPTKSDSTRAAELSDSPFDTWELDIITGENYNNSSCKLAYAMFNDGKPKDRVLRYLKGLYLQVENQDSRWQQRVNHLPKLVEEQYKTWQSKEEILDIDLIDPIESDVKYDISWPPGMMGDLAKCAYDAQLFQYKIVAIVSALGLMNGIAGRRFNISEPATGLNLYQTLIMDSGMGKDSIRTFISRMLIRYNELGASYKAFGPEYFTSPKAIFNALDENKCLVSVFTEAGYMFKSQTGDQAGLQRVLLGLYTQSGREGISSKEAYASKDNYIQRIQAPCLSIIHEATPITLLEELKKKDASETGQLARMSIYRVYGEKPMPNMEAKLHVPEALDYKIQRLVKECAKAHSELIPDVVQIENPKGYQEYWEDCVRKERYYKQDNPVLSNMYTRANVKALKIAALVSLLDENSEIGFISDSVWNWAVELVDYELSGITSLFNGHGAESSPLEDAMYSIIMPAIQKFFKGTSKTVRARASKNQLRLKIFPRSAIHQATKGRAGLKALEDTYNRTTPLDKVLDHMERIGYIKIYDPKEHKQEFKRLDKVKAHYQITKEFELSWTMRHEI